MKKFLALLLALMMIMGMAACGADNGQQPETPSSKPSNSVSAEPSNEPSGSGDGYNTDSWEAITLRMTNGMSENDIISKSIVAFCDYVEEKSNGKITFERSLGGTFCATPEEFDYLSSGVIDVAAILVAPSASKLPIWNVMPPSTSVQDSLDLANWLVWENEETSAILIGQYNDNNAMPLAYATSGNTLYVCTKEWDTWEDLSKYAYGTAISAKIFEALGLNVQSVQLADQYESLSRGVIDATGSGIPAVYSNKLYEVAPYGVLSGCANSSNILSFNLDTWNSLNEEQQALMREAAEYYTSYNIENYNILKEQYIADMEAQGAVIKHMTDEDNQFYLRTSYPASYESYKTYCENLGCVEDYEVICDAISEWQGWNIRTGE